MTEAQRADPYATRFRARFRARSLPSCPFPASEASHGCHDFMLRRTQKDPGPAPRSAAGCRRPWPDLARSPNTSTTAWSSMVQLGETAPGSPELAAGLLQPRVKRVRRLLAVWSIKQRAVCFFWSNCSQVGEAEPAICRPLLSCRCQPLKLYASCCTD